MLSNSQLFIRSFGIAGTLFKTYLSHRHQYVCVNNNYSDFPHVLLGVPQGSILGPLFFVLYINDLSNCLQFSIPYIYADDTAEADFLQRDIDNLFQWTVLSDLYFNFSKFAHLQSWTKSNLSFTYKIDNKPKAKVETIKDLGIIMI